MTVRTTNAGRVRAETSPMRYLKPLSETLNRAVLALAARHWPHGWEPVDFDTQGAIASLIASHDRPLDYVPAWLGPGARFPVFAGASDRTIFGDPAVNYAFRAWHDAWHLRLRAPFTVEGERRVHAAQDAELALWLLGQGLPVPIHDTGAYTAPRYWDGYSKAHRYAPYAGATQITSWPAGGRERALLRAEIVGQLEHQRAHGAFPVNQRAFVRAYIRNSERALARRW